MTTLGMGSTNDPPRPADEPADSSDDVTLADEEWPVAEHYRVEPRVPPAADATVLGEQPIDRGPVRRFPPDVGPGLLAALFGVMLLVVLIPAGLWLAANRADGESAAPEPSTIDTGSEAPTSPQTTTPTGADSAKTVPELTGSTLANARAHLESMKLRVRFSRTASDKPADEVLRQSPGPGSKLTVNGIVVLTVSAGPERIAVPRVEGLAAGEATRVLREAGLRSQVRRTRSTEPAGIVIGQVPSAGQEVSQQTVVLLEIARSAPKPPPTEPTMVEVPRLTGLPAAEARSKLRDLGLRWAERPVSSSQPEGTVIGQSPSAGAELRKGGTVTLEVSTAPTSVDVPDVTGLDEQSAIRELESAGFEVHVIDEPTAQVTEDGIVLRQNPAGGSSGKKGSVVILTVARLS